MLCRVPPAANARIPFRVLGVLHPRQAACPVSDADALCPITLWERPKLTLLPLPPPESFAQSTRHCRT
eukprot:36728-Pleurochrysis_carterae.AAC.1